MKDCALTAEIRFANQMPRFHKKFCFQVRLALGRTEEACSDFNKARELLSPVRCLFVCSTRMKPDHAQFGRIVRKEYRPECGSFAFVSHLD